MTTNGRHCYFHAGKGGVGKSTSSALAAMHVARTGRKVLLVSLDPAHNQADIFDMPLGAKPREIVPNLRAAQADIDAWVAEYLRGVEGQMRRSYSYQTAFNLEKHLGVIKHSPGIEEYALLLAFRHYLDTGGDADTVIFDMPPTALTTKFFHLPALSLLWVGELLKLRAKILEKKEIITKIQVGKKEFERDKITGKLQQQQDFFRELEALFKNPDACSIHIVVNPDKLSFAEAKRVRDTLSDMGMDLAAVLMNKTGPDSDWDRRDSLFKDNRVCPLPLSDTPLIGLDALNAYLDRHADSLAFLDRG